MALSYLIFSPALELRTLSGQSHSAVTKVTAPNNRCSRSRGAPKQENGRKLYLCLESDVAGAKALAKVFGRGETRTLSGSDIQK
jgi:hypothetical protein